MFALRRVATTALVSLALLSGVACSGTDLGNQSENATDSFSNPTEHGYLEFTASNPATFTEEERFHAWTFTLTDAAEVELQAKAVTQNLGTILYLYKRGESGNWGSYVAKDEGEPSASVAQSLEAGEYRIKVKALRTWQTGSFTLEGACQGAGCPAAPTDHVCTGPSELDDDGGYNPSCEAILDAIRATEPKPTPASCSEALEPRAVALYKAYWDNVLGYDELTGGENDEPYVNVTYYPGAGAIADVGLGGDEDAMDFVFDANGNMVYYYQHNQSPDWAWSCPGGPEGEAPEEPWELP
ncbi:MAG: hypothetical protein R3B72_44435 [Polyangiaceae bacterium]